MQRRYTGLSSRVARFLQREPMRLIAVHSATICPCLPLCRTNPRRYPRWRPQSFPPRECQPPPKLRPRLNRRRPRLRPSGSLRAAAAKAARSTARGGGGGQPFQVAPKEGGLQRDTGLHLARSQGVEGLPAAVRWHPSRSRSLTGPSSFMLRWLARATLARVLMRVAPLGSSSIFNMDSDVDIMCHWP